MASKLRCEAGSDGAKGKQINSVIQYDYEIRFSGSCAVPLLM